VSPPELIEQARVEAWRRIVARLGPGLSLADELGERAMGKLVAGGYTVDYEIDKDGLEYPVYTPPFAGHEAVAEECELVGCGGAGRLRRQERPGRGLVLTYGTGDYYESCPPGKDERKWLEELAARQLEWEAAQTNREERESGGGQVASELLDPEEVEEYGVECMLFGDQHARDWAERRRQENEAELAAYAAAAARLIRRRAPRAVVGTHRRGRSGAPRGRRTRSSTKARSPGRPSGSSDDDPDLGRRCAVCGGSLDGRRRQTRTCSNKCRQAAYRERQRGASEPIAVKPATLCRYRWTEAALTQRAQRRDPTIRNSDVRDLLSDWLERGIAERGPNGWWLTPEWQHELSACGAGWPDDEEIAA
jgi:hypothetical protein